MGQREVNGLVCHFSVMPVDCHCMPMLFGLLSTSRFTIYALSFAFNIGEIKVDLLVD